MVAESFLISGMSGRGLAIHLIMEQGCSTDNVTESDIPSGKVLRPTTLFKFAWSMFAPFWN